MLLHHHIPYRIQLPEHLPLYGSLLHNHRHKDMLFRLRLPHPHLLHHNMPTVARFPSSGGLRPDSKEPVRGMSFPLRIVIHLHIPEPEENRSFPDYRFPHWSQPEAHIRSYAHRNLPPHVLLLWYVHRFHKYPEEHFRCLLRNFLSILHPQLQNYILSDVRSLPGYLLCPLYLQNPR